MEESYAYDFNESDFARSWWQSWFNVHCYISFFSANLLFFFSFFFSYWNSQNYIKKINEEEEKMLQSR